MLRPLGFVALLSAGLPLRAHADAFPDTIRFDGFEACGLQCLRPTCPGNGTTSLSGTIFAPNGTLPLPNVEVYVPNAAVGAFVDGPNAPRCDEAPSGHSLVATLTDANGNFVLKDVPATTGLPVVVVAGKWRRQLTVDVPACTNTALDVAKTRLPKDHTEGDIPHIAIATGNADALECVMRKAGVADTEFGSNAGSARIHLFASNGISKIDGGPTLADSTTLWASSASLSAYDQVMFACEGGQNPNTKTNTATAALKTYADAGGRAYLAHWQNIWIVGYDGPPSIAGAWPTVATWDVNTATPTGAFVGQINGGFAQGANLSSWLSLVGASASTGTLSIAQPKQTAITIDTSTARSWIYLDTTSNNKPSVQYFSFTTPIDMAAGAQKGRVLFTDMHGSSGDSSPTNGSFPSGGCTTAVSAMNPQEKALIYATFDLQRCVGSTNE